MIVIPEGNLRLVRPRTVSGGTTINDRLHTELWTSWASLLRSYAAAHGINSTHHAVVEVSATEITLRVSDRWLRFTPTTVQHNHQDVAFFALTEDGNVILNEEPAEAMDMAAERLTRAMLHPPQETGSK